MDASVSATGRTILSILGDSSVLAQVRHDNDEKPSKPFRISSGYGRVCTTFLIQLKVFRQAEAELPQ